jgi:hypothetical protein
LSEGCRTLGLKWPGATYHRAIAAYGRDATESQPSECQGLETTSGQSGHKSYCRVLGTWEETMSEVMEMSGRRTHPSEACPHTVSDPVSELGSLSPNCSTAVTCVVMDGRPTAHPATRRIMTGDKCANCTLSKPYHCHTITKLK